MQENFGKMHMEDEVMKQRGAKLRDLIEGYPDMGNGRYSANLSYKDWYIFNRAQRGHKNFLENLTISCVFLLASGIGYPLLAIGLGMLLLVARPLYLCGYSRYFGYLPQICVHIVLAMASFSSVN